MSKTAEDSWAVLAGAVGREGDFFFGADWAVVLLLVGGGGGVFRVDVFL